jgi:hypothetical protein
MAAEVLRCPRTRHLMDLEVCLARQGRKTHGCVTCRAPKQYLRDMGIIANLRVVRATEGKTLEPFTLKGLPVKFSARVARELIRRLEDAVRV